MNPNLACNKLSDKEMAEFWAEFWAEIHAEVWATTRRKLAVQRVRAPRKLSPRRRPVVALSR